MTVCKFVERLNTLQAAVRYLSVEHQRRESAPFLLSNLPPSPMGEVMVRFFTTRVVGKKCSNSVQLPLEKKEGGDLRRGKFCLSALGFWALFLEA